MNKTTSFLHLPDRPTNKTNTNIPNKTTTKWRGETTKIYTKQMRPTKPKNVKANSLVPLNTERERV